MTINEAANKAHSHASACGFYYSQTRWGILSPEELIHDKIIAESKELFNAEECKVNTFAVKLMANAMTTTAGKTDFEKEVKNTIPDELTDIILTAISGMVELGYDVEAHLRAKLAYNEVREDHNILRSK